MNTLYWAFFEQGCDVLKRSLSISESIGDRSTGTYCRLNLGLAYTRLGEAELALDNLMEASSTLDELEDTFGQGSVNLYKGYAYELIDDMPAAKESFAEAVKILEEIEVPGMALEAKAGVGRCLLSIEDFGAAESVITEVWALINEQGTQGAEFPVLIYLTCANGFMIFGDDELSRKAIVDGKEMLDQWADKIKDEEWRFAYLNNFPEHVAIQAMYDELASR